MIDYQNFKRYFKFSLYLKLYLVYEFVIMNKYVLFFIFTLQLLKIKSRTEPVLYLIAILKPIINPASYNQNDTHLHVSRREVNRNKFNTNYVSEKYDFSVGKIILCLSRFVLSDRMQICIGEQLSKLTTQKTI